jgi:hypothetical protein
MVYLQHQPFTASGVTVTPPRPLDRANLGCDATPDPAGAFPFFCPICMMSFRRSLATRCCFNNICEVCAAEMIDAHVSKSPLQRALRRTHAYRQRLQQEQARRLQRRRGSQQQAARQREQQHRRRRDASGRDVTLGGPFDTGFSVADDDDDEDEDNARSSCAMAGDAGDADDLSDPSGIFIADCTEAPDGSLAPIVAMPCPYCTRSLALAPLPRPTGGKSQIAEIGLIDEVQPRRRSVLPLSPSSLAYRGEHLPSDHSPVPGVVPYAGGRNYQDSPGVALALGRGKDLSSASPSIATESPRPHTSFHSSTPVTNGLPPRPPSAGPRLRVAAATGVYSPSPVKVGDEFHALRRKLKPLGTIDPNSAVGKEHAALAKKRETQERSVAAGSSASGSGLVELVAYRDALRPPSGLNNNNNRRIIAQDAIVLRGGATGRSNDTTTSDGAAALNPLAGRGSGTANDNNNSSSAPAPRGRGAVEQSTADGGHHTRRTDKKKKDDDGFKCVVM